MKIAIWVLAAGLLGTPSFASEGETATTLNVPQPIWRGLVIDAGASFNMANPHEVGIVYGGNGSVGVGVRLSRFTVGALYRGIGGATADLGLLGGSYYAANFWGGHFDGDLLSSDSHSMRLGLDAGRFMVSGIRTFLAIPYATDKMGSWAVGPTLTYTYSFNRWFGLGVRAGYLYVLGGTNSSDGFWGPESTSIASFSSFDVGARLEFRLF